jgi:RNA 2',3'-cyclic 3'-phosphodiesterase
VRLFVAVELDEVVRREAARAARTLAAALDRQGAGRRVGWVAEPNLHLTLQFLGEVDPPTARTVTDRLSEPLTIPPFDVVLGGLGTFPPAGPPRVIWAGVTEGADQLSMCQGEVGRRLEGLGFPRERRPFRAHLTLGRVKAPLGARIGEIFAEAVLAREARCRVDHLTLFESHLSPRGATYSVVAIARLGYHHS